VRQLQYRFGQSLALRSFRAPGLGSESILDFGIARSVRNELLTRAANGSQASVNGGVAGLPCWEKRGEISRDLGSSARKGSKRE
jgi:hypothetical protein